MTKPRECANCKKPLERWQKRFCSTPCKNIKQISPHRQRVLDYRKTHADCTNQQIADALGISLTVVRSALYRFGTYKDVSDDINRARTNRKTADT